MILSIIIPTLNEEKYLPRLLKSIYGQKDFLDFEVIVSDGNSKDKTQEIAKSFGCKVITNNKRHPSYQRNDGAKVARGELLLFLDADTGIPDNFLGPIVKEFKNRKLVGAGFYIKVKSKKGFYRRMTKCLNFLFWLGQIIRPAYVGIAMMARKETHVKVKGFDETIFVGEDYDYSYKLFKQGKVKMIKSSFVYYSLRRLEKEGKWKVIGRWGKGTWYVLTKGPIKKKIVKYDFGDY